MPLRPRSFAISEKCKALCSLNARNLPGKAADMVHAWYEAGDNNRKIVDQAAKIGVTLSERAVARHRANHLVPDDQLVDGEDKDEKIGELELLDVIIQRGGKDLKAKTARVSAEQALRAIELKFKLTQGSALDDFLKAIGATMDDDLPADDENPDAMGAPDEQPDPDPE